MKLKYLKILTLKKVKGFIYKHFAKYFIFSLCDVKILSFSMKFFIFAFKILEDPDNLLRFIFGRLHFGT